MMNEIYIPTLHSFAMNNLFTGSCGMLRFRARPEIVMATQKEVDFEKSTIVAEYWHGLLCYEMSEVEGIESFPMTEEGRLAMKAWLESHIEEG